MKTLISKYTEHLMERLKAARAASTKQVESKGQGGAIRIEFVPKQ